MPPTPKGLYHVTVVGELHGERTQNGFFFQSKDSSQYLDHFPEAQSLLNSFNGPPLEAIKSFASQDWRILSTVVTTLIPRMGPVFEQEHLTKTGAQTYESLPSYCAGVLTLRTGFGGRSNHGRLYFPGVSEDLSVNSRLEGSSLAQLSDIGNILLATYGGGGSNDVHRWGVFSRKLGTVRHLGPPPWIEFQHVGFKPVFETIARPVVYTMRKRMLHRGA